MSTSNKRNLRSFIQKSAEYRLNAATWFETNKDYLLNFHGMAGVFSAMSAGEISVDFAFGKAMEILSVELLNRAINSSSKETGSRGPRTEKRYTAELYYSDGGGVERIRENKSFDNFQQANDYVQRKLSEDYCGTRGIVSGLGFMTEISRTDAIGSFWGSRRAKTLTKKRSFGNKLKFVGKAKQTRASFSHG
jgi:hypothetical protein